MTDFASVTLAMGDVAWLAIAFTLGILARLVRLPPLVGYLAAGFLLKAIGAVEGELLQKMADLGITLLLFTVGLKLNLATLGRPQVWAVSAIHMTAVVVASSAVIYGLAALGLSLYTGLDLTTSALIAFALSFSSTVFVVKVLEERAESRALHGRIAIGILIMQDIAAVAFLALAGGKVPTMWAVLLVLLIPLRHLLHRVFDRVGHGELLVLFGFLLALGGAEVFDLVGVKGDLGALVLGVLVASHARSDELAKTMLGFKDLFLLGFFLSIGMSGHLTMETLLIGVTLFPLVLLKGVLFFALLTRFRLRARTSLMASINLSNYSEFGLIVAAICAASGWIQNEWLTAIAIALSLSFASAAALDLVVHRLYVQYRSFWQRFQKADLLPEDRLLDLGGATIAVIGAGGVGTGAYDTMRARHGETVVGIDIDPVTVRNQQRLGRNVILGDPSDSDFWDRMHASHTLDLVMIALPRVTATLEVLTCIRESSVDAHVAATARFPDEVATLEAAGVATVFNVYTEAGAGFATHVAAQVSLPDTAPTAGDRVPGD